MLLFFLCKENKCPCDQIIEKYGNQVSFTCGEYKKALNSELPDKCATPSGYSDEQWKEHMGHHPDRYAECLG